MTTTSTLPVNLSEAQFERTVIDAAMLMGWRVAHFRPARTASGGWATPMSGHIGYPDLTLCRDGVVLVAELKSRSGQPTPEQRAWLTALGAHGRLWRPAHWQDILAELRDGPTEGASG